MELNEKLYELRKKKNWSQEELAEKLEVSRQTVSKWESNKAIPELDKLIKISEIYNITLDELVKNVSNKDIFNKKKKIKKVLKILLILFVVALIVGSILFVFFIKNRINIINEIGERYKSTFDVIGETKSGFVNEVSVIEDKNSIEEIHRNYYYYVNEDERLLKIEVFEESGATDVVEEIYIDLNKENEDLLFDDVVIVNLKTGLRQEVDNYEFESPITKATTILNNDIGMIWAWDGNPDAKKIALDLNNEFIKQDDALAWNYDKTEDINNSMSMAMSYESFGVDFERYNEWPKEEKEFVLITMFSGSEYVPTGEVTREFVTE